MRNVLDKEDFESLSNYANTRYGGSMRASPLGAARHTQYGVTSANSEHKPVNTGIAGSDGFKRSAVSNMQHTFMSGGLGSSQLDNMSNNGSAIGNPNIGLHYQRQT